VAPGGTRSTLPWVPVVNLLLNWDRNRVGDPVHADPVHLAALATRIRERLARADKGIE